MNKNYKIQEERLPFIYQILKFYAQNDEVQDHLEKEMKQLEKDENENVNLCPFCRCDYEHLQEIEKDMSNYYKLSKQTEIKFLRALRQSNALYYLLVFSAIIMMVSIGLFFLLK